jgi:hypothetical protein
VLLQFDCVNLNSFSHPASHSRGKLVWFVCSEPAKAFPAKLNDVQPHFRLLFLLAWAIPAAGQPASGVDQDLTPAQGQALVETALGNELRAAHDASHMMRYRLRKTSPRLTTTKEICETRDGDVARLVSTNDRPLSPADEQKEVARLQELLGDPGRQRRRKQAEDTDAGRALKVLRALPAAFDYQYAGTVESATGKMEKFTFRPRPNFSPPDLETQVLTSMAGEIWIDPVHQRVLRLEGHVLQDVDFGWGILGRLNHGGWIVIEQTDVGEGQWRIVHFQMAMSGRVFFKSRTFDTMEEETHFEPVPADLDYRTAIQSLLAGP